MEWFVQRRMRYIDVMLSWYGRFSTKQLSEFFGISRVQASKDIAYFKDVNPNRMEYSTSERRYQIIPPTSEKEKLSEPESIFEFTSHDSPLPFVSRLPKLRRNLELSHIHDITWAISHNKQVRIKYTSQSSPNGAVRVIQPHEFIFASSRWHVRAYCLSRGDFRDFSLSRILETEKKDESLEEALPKLDKSWHKKLSLIIKPHPNLDKSTKELVKREFNMLGGVTQLEVRAALLVYTLQENRIALDETSSSIEFHLILSNREQLKNYLW